ncbi:unnamed protein product, partial [Effrenium voratum]
MAQAFQKLPLMPPQQRLCQQAMRNEWGCWDRIRAELREGDVIWLETPLNPTCEARNSRRLATGTRGLQE